MMQMMPEGDAMKMMSDTMMKNGKEMSGPMMMMDDMKMDNGKMISDMMMAK